MTQPLLSETPEKIRQQIQGREASPDSAQLCQVGLQPIQQLQRTLGNRQVAQLIQAKRLRPDGQILGIQRKLTVGAAYDQYEQEADWVARQVMNTPDAAVAKSMQRSMSSEEDKDMMLQTKPLAASISPFMQRVMMNDEEPGEKEKPVQARFLTQTSREPLQRQSETEEDKKEPIQAKSAESMSDSFEAGNDVETQLSLSKGRGSPLPDLVRAYMEPRFGIDFSRVRVHTGSDALQMARHVGAQAFTHGSDIYFGEGRSPTNLELTAHELTHVVQQTGEAPLQTKKQEQPVAPLALRHLSNGVVLRAPKASKPCPTCAVNQEEMVQRQTHQEGGAPSERGKKPLNFLSTGSRLLQRDFKSDFAGKTSTPAAANAPAAPGTVRVQTIAPQGGTATWVNAPYGIYSPGEIPKEYHSQIMESGKAFQWRNEGRIDGIGLDRERERLANEGELTVGDMLKYSQRAGAKKNIRIAMAKVGNDFRFVGYDMSRGDAGEAVHAGFVESEKGTTSGVGRALFADRVTRALLNRASGMNLEVYTTPRTAKFHAEIYAAVGRSGAPTERQKYQLTTAEMVKLAVAWNPKLSPSQVSNLNALLVGGGKVSAADAEAALLRGAVQDRPPPRGSGGGGPGAGGPVAPPITSTGAQAKGRFLSWGAQALLAKQISNMQSAEKAKALARFAELSPEIGRLLDENYAVTITVEVEVPKSVNIAGVITQTDPSMIVYYRNMYIDRAMKIRPPKPPGEVEQSGYYPVGQVADKYSNPRRWDNPHEYTLDQQIRVQMGDPDPTGRDKPNHPTHKVMKRSQTLTPQIADALETVKNNPQAAAPPPKPEPKIDEETAKKLAAAPSRVYLLTENVVQYNTAVQVREKLKANPIFQVTGEAMAGGGRTVTRVIYWSEYDKPRAEKLAELLRAEGLPAAKASSGGTGKTPGYLQINFGSDAEK